MSCDYKILGEATLIRSPEVDEAIQSLRHDILGEDYVELQAIDDLTVRLRVDYDDVNTVNTPDHVAGVLDSIGSAVVGSAAFEITTGGETWTEWIGDVREDKSLAALRAIEDLMKELTPGHVTRAIQFLTKRQDGGR